MANSSPHVLIIEIRNHLDSHKFTFRSNVNFAQSQELQPRVNAIIRANPIQD